ncbi:hypothetical protein [Clostridium sp. DSM 8431]|nr:hypothetical protein [Clostridium sp. DSM 8431]
MANSMEEMQKSLKDMIRSIKDNANTVSEKFRKSFDNSTRNF